MRAIKFRGKRLDNGEWVYGSLCNYLFEGMKKTEPCIHIGNLGYIKNAFYQVAPDTVGQFTGLLDKNGKEIYEGDVLNGTTNKWVMEDKPEPHDFVGYVRWESQCDIGMEWVLTTMDSTGSDPLNVYVHCVAIDYSTGVIIGNIHDNPELLR